MLTMAARTLGVLTTTLLEGDDLLAAVVFDNFSLDDGTLDEGSTELGVGTFADHENFGEFYSCACLCFQLFDGQHGVGRYAVLLTPVLMTANIFYPFMFVPALPANASWPSFYQSE